MPKTPRVTDELRKLVFSEMGKAGGRNRAKKLSKAQRAEIARLGGLAKAAKKKKSGNQ